MKINEYKILQECCKLLDKKLTPFGRLLHLSKSGKISVSIKDKEEFMQN